MDCDSYHFLGKVKHHFSSLNTINEGKVAVGDLSGFLPCTPNGVIELAKRSGINLEGAQAVVLGRSKIVGTPVAELLKWNHATVTVCHSKTRDLKEQVMVFSEYFFVILYISSLCCT